MREEQFRIFVGVDWGSECHQVCVMTPEGEVLSERALPHEAQALHRLADALIELAGGEAGRVAVGIEVPHGVVVETLLDRGLVLFAINPKQLDRFRDRFSMAGAKDDRRDAQVAADSLRTDRHAFRRVQPTAAHLLALREESRLHDELVAQCVQASNRWQQHLQRFYPQLLKLGDATEPWLWELWELAPTPAAAAKLRPARVEKLLQRHRIRRHGAADVLAHLRAPAFTVAPGTAEAACRHLEVVVEQLRLLDRQRRQCRARLKRLLERCTERPAGEAGGARREHSDAELLLSMPGVGELVASTVLAEAGHPLAARDHSTLRALCGIAPVTKRSGKTLTVMRRYACNPRLHNACYYWAQSAARWDPVSHEHYRRLRARGHSHGRACRGVMDRLLAVLIAMLEQQTLYDPTRRHRFPAAA